MKETRFVSAVLLPATIELEYALSILDELIPTSSARVYDLVRAAGVDVTDWGSGKGGIEKAASNPKYCYEWSFVQKDQLVVLNLWHEELRITPAGLIVQQLNMRAFAAELSADARRKPIASRALRMDEAVSHAYENALPVRVIVCDGYRRDRNKPDAPSSSVKYRVLDSVPWAVTNYDTVTGRTTITRGVEPFSFVDQFELLEIGSGIPVRRATSGERFVRDPEVRQAVLRRAKGRCEWCGEMGFLMENAKIYLETHHVVPLSEGGPDTDRNVVALCANHHREAHYGANRGAMRNELSTKLHRIDT